MIKIGNGAACAVAGKTGLAAVCVIDARDEISSRRVLCAADYYYAVRARAVMAVTDGARKIIEGFDSGDRLLLKDYVVVAEALEFNELHSNKE